MSHRSARGRDDAGFTMLETLISVGVIGVVMAGLALFFLQANATARRQAETQAAAQITMAAMEQVSLYPGSSVLQGRSREDVLAQWRAPGVDTYLAPATTELAWEDLSDGGAPAAAALPTTPQAVQVAGAVSQYRQSWYVGRCWQEREEGACVVVPEHTRAGMIEMYRVVVAVTWRSKDCADQLCSYVAATLLGSDQEDPTFE